MITNAGRPNFGIWSKLNVSSKTFIKTYASKWTIVW